jgi:NADPH-dependent 2,4-dienoyl-CoA reductase/sulfur reductase-like enzyme
MADKTKPAADVCDMLAIGSGASKLALAVPAPKAGLDVVVLEKEP